MRPPPALVPPSPCRSCGKINDMASAVFSVELPAPGDLTICLYCGHLMMFADDLTLRDPTDAEMQEIAGDRRVLEIQKQRLKLKQEIEEMNESGKYGEPLFEDKEKK